MNVLWSARDPGGANAIAPVLRALQERGEILQGIAEEPAARMLFEKGLKIQQPGNLSAQISAFQPDVFLSGTSAGESVDKQIMNVIDVPSIYVSDFWSNYRLRFPVVPSVVCVIDDRMKEEMVATGFPENVLRITGNPHFDHFADGISRAGEKNGSALFISQPVSEQATAYGFDEFSVLEDIIVALPEHNTLSIRLHPKEAPDKYNAYLQARVSVSRERTLEEALSNAAIVIGMFSPVLMQAAAAGKKAISYEPNLNTNDPLPTNALGLTLGVRSKDVLTAAIQNDTPSSGNFRALFPAGATERVVSVIDSFVS